MDVNKLFRRSFDVDRQGFRIFPMCLEVMLKRDGNSTVKAGPLNTGRPNYDLAWLHRVPASQPSSDNRLDERPRPGDLATDNDRFGVNSMDKIAYALAQVFGGD